MYKENHRLPSLSVFLFCRGRFSGNRFGSGKLKVFVAADHAACSCVRSDCLQAVNEMVSWPTTTASSSSSFILHQGHIMISSNVVVCVFLLTPVYTNVYGGWLQIFKKIVGSSVLQLRFAASGLQYDALQRLLFSKVPFLSASFTRLPIQCFM